MSSIDVSTYENVELLFSVASIILNNSEESNIFCVSDELDEINTSDECESFDFDESDTSDDFDISNVYDETDTFDSTASQELDECNT